MFRKRTFQPKLRPCFFCTDKQEPDYKNVEISRRYCSDRGKILGRTRTGICRQHQKKLTMAIKRARILALLPFTVKVR